MKYLLDKINISYFVIFVSFTIISVPNMAFSMVKCSKKDSSFKEFLIKFEEGKEFQQNRIIFPLVVRFGDYTMTNIIIELWNLKKINNIGYPLIMSPQAQHKKRIAESVVLSTNRYAEIFHDGPPESDIYRVLYKFRNIDDCWFLEEMHDKSK